MTSSERTLNTVLSTLNVKIPEAQGDKIGVLKARIAYLENRLDEVRLIVEKRVLANAKISIA